MTNNAILGYNVGEYLGGLAAQQIELKIGVYRNNYLVIFTVDGSGFISGRRWKHGGRAINIFMDNPLDEDMIFTIIFNDRA